MARRLDYAPLACGLSIIGFGVVLLLDASGTLRIHFEALWPIATFIAGATLLATGLTRRN